jgi:hypothetical protein
VKNDGTSSYSYDLIPTDYHMLLQPAGDSGKEIGNRAGRQNIVGRGACRSIGVVVGKNNSRRPAGKHCV